MEITSAKNQTLPGYLETIGKNVSELAKYLNHEIPGCMGQGSSLDLHRQLELNEALISMQRQLAELLQTSKDLIEAFGQNAPKA